MVSWVLFTLDVRHPPLALNNKKPHGLPSCGGKEWVCLPQCRWAFFEESFFSVQDAFSLDLQKLAPELPEAAKNESRTCQDSVVPSTQVQCQQLHFGLPLIW